LQLSHFKTDTVGTSAFAPVCSRLVATCIAALLLVQAPFALAQSGAAAEGLPGMAAAQGAAGQFPDRTLMKSAVGAQSTTTTEDTKAPEAKPRTLRPLQPSQFQRFVEESTGRLLPIFGAELFEDAQAYSPDTALPAPAEYVLGPGDEVRVQVWGAVDYSGSHTLDRNGQINLPKVGTFSLAGVPVRDLEAVLRGQVGKVFNNFSVNASLGRLRSIQVYVVGQARMPGTYKLSSMSTVVNALFASGGPTANGSMRNVQLTRAGKVVATLDLYDFISRGDKGRDMPLQSGDVVVVPPAGARVALTGALDQAAVYELKSANTSVGDVLNLSGGVPALAKAQKALLERIQTDKTTAREVQEIALNATGLKTPMRDGDVLTMLPISQAFGNAVTLQGTVAEPLRYRWFEGMKVLDLIPDREALITPAYYKRKNNLVQGNQALPVPLAADGTPLAPSGAGNTSAFGTDATTTAGSKITNRVKNLADQINWEYAVIERLDTQNLTTRLLPFNLGRAVLEKDPVHNLALLPGDVVTIMSQNDLRLPQERQHRMVRVEGEVAAPGVYQALPGETLPQLLRRVGGLSAQAYVFGTEFNRESVRQRQQENLDTLIRRLEAQAQSQATTVASNARAENQAQAQALLQQQQAQLKAQVERLRAMRSNGRMALELDPSGKELGALPAIALEDGDRILVPSVPSFVAAYGSVNNENVFLYKPGKTVSDVIRSAGLTEDAEPAQAFVLRADGSIVARRDRSGLFGGNFETLALMPGDTVVVPAQLDRESSYNFTVRALKDWTQILSNFGLGVAAFKSL
jgi:protein involved in polysaccharide export with SLBB domain